MASRGRPLATQLIEMHLAVHIAGTTRPFVVRCDLNERECAIVLVGGALARAKEELTLQLVTT